MSAWIVRPSRPSDAAAASDLLARSYGALLAGHYDPDLLELALPFMVTANPKLLGCGTWYLAEQADGALLGCGGWTLERPGTGELEAGLAHLRHFATDPRAVRQGVGRALVERSFAAAAQHGVTRFECYATLPAERFYRSVGFRTVEAIELPMGQGPRLPSLRMVRDL